MKTALFIILPYPSHYISCAGLARLMRQDGWATIATVSEYSVHHARSQGFETLKWEYFRKETCENIKKFVGYSIRNYLDRSFAFKRARESYKHYFYYNEQIERIKPDIVFIDTHLGFYSIFGNQKVVLLETKLSARRQQYIPPYISSLIAKDNLMGLVAANFSWAYCTYRRNIESVAERIAFGFSNDVNFFRKIACKSGIDVNLIMFKGIPLYEVWSHMKSIILTPSCFEYPFYKEHKLDKHVWVPSENRYNKAISNIEVPLPANSDLKLIYFSMGTIATGNSVLYLLRLLIEVVKENSAYFLIASCGNLLESVNNHASERISLLRTVQQSKLLHICDLFVTHGGLNSVKEAIEAGVPMLVFPINEKSDQPGNACRIVYHGIGMRSKIHRVSKKSLKNNISKILKTDTYREQCHRLQQKFMREADIDISICNSI